VTVVGDELAYTVDLEHMTRHAGDQPQARTLRCTQAARHCRHHREPATEWIMLGGHSQRHEGALAARRSL
jgi:hypothetical protein